MNDASIGSGSGGRVAVIGGGIAGLATAWALTAAGHRVVVYEAGTVWGGKILSGPFAGLDGIDAGADAFLARVPEAQSLAVELGLADQLVAPATGSALVVRSGRLHPIPDGLVLGVPAGLTGLARSRLISWPGKIRALADLVLPRTVDHGDSLGGLIRRRFGAEVAGYLVDPLVGSINAGDTDELSLVAATPQIAAVVARSRSVLLGLRRLSRAAPSGPVFLTPKGGMGVLVDRLVSRLIDSGADMNTGVTVERLIPGRGWTLSLSGLRANDHVDAVVIACPAEASAALVREHSTVAADLLDSIEYAGVVMITASVPSEELAGVGACSGYLVPKPEQGHVTAVSFASRKWPHWSTPGHDVLRISLGHIANAAPLALADDELSALALGEVGGHLGLGRPLRADHIRITRWPNAFPQYRPGHPDLVDRIDHSVSTSLPLVALAGAPYRGIGLPACIRDGQRAARLLTKQLANQPE